MKKSNPMVNLLPLLDDQGQNDLLALMRVYQQADSIGPFDGQTSARIARFAEWRQKIVTKRTA